MSGTLVLTDTLDRSFDEIFQTSSKGIDAEVRGEELFESDFGGTSRARLDASLVATVQGLDGVRVAAGSISPEAVQALDTEGDQSGPPQAPPTWDETYLHDPHAKAFLIPTDHPP